jgi:two-component system, NarL family, sensor histidine kinase DegS
MATSNQITSNAQSAPPDPWEEFRQEIASELDQSERALKEITLMLEQSQIDLRKLTQRNTAITAHLQQVQAQIDSLPRADIRMAYDSALDAQQRLLLTRGQLEKLQSDQSYLQRYVSLVNRSVKMFEGNRPSQPAKTGAASNTLEMTVNAQEAERQRLSRQMHDGPAQALSNFILQTEIAMKLFDIDQAKAREELSSLKMAAMGTFQKVRNFIFELRPMMLDDLGLVPTVKRYSDTFKEQTGIEPTLAISGSEKRLQPYLEVMIFRALQELLGNVAKHSQATQVKVQLTLDENSARLSVEDNGKGFNPESFAEAGGLGLKLIRERVELLGGKLDIDTGIGRGSRISFQIPASNLVS